jgi:hypothetical protein
VSRVVNGGVVVLVVSSRRGIVAVTDIEISRQHTCLPQIIGREWTGKRQG